MQQEIDQKVHKVPQESIAFAPNTTESTQDNEKWKFHITLLSIIYYLHIKRINTTYPFKGENPAATSYAQQNIEGPSVAPGHHVSCALTDLVDDRKTSQCFHNLVDDMLLSTRVESI